MTQVEHGMPDWFDKIPATLKRLVEACGTAIVSDMDKRFTAAELDILLQNVCNYTKRMLIGDGVVNSEMHLFMHAAGIS